MPAAYPEILLDTAAYLAMALERHGLAADVADEAAFKAAEELRQHWGGRYLYIPKGDQYDVAEEHARAFEAWKAGATVEQIATERGWSTRWTRAVLQAVRKARRQRATGAALFPEMEEPA